MPPSASPSSSASWIELDAASLRANVELFRSFARGSPQLGAVLKGNAYGHGLDELLPVTHPLVDVIYVIAADDALRVRELERQAGLAPRQVVVLGALTADEALELARAQVDVVVADRAWTDVATRLRAEGLRLACHVHIDTGLGREGFTLAQLPEELGFLREAADVLEVRGALTHFANVEDVTEQDYARAQTHAFDEAHDRLLRLLGLDRLQRHVAASAAALLMPDARYEAVRVGIALYGLWPSPETRLSARLVLREVPRLHPVLSWRCRSQAVKWLPEGAFVGYGCTYRCPQPTRVAVLPVGYFDGYPRLVSGKAHVLVNGQRCPVLGRVMMNHLVVDVTLATNDDAPVVATLIGQDGNECVSAELLAGWAQTINYEIVARLGAHIRRVVV